MTGPPGRGHPAPRRRWLWLAGAALTLAAFAAAHLRTAALVWRTQEDDGVRTTRESVSPFVWGFFNPVVVWPEQANEWPDALRRSVMSHEREHARRFDFLWLVVAQLACAVYWFLPLAWFAARKAREESERACDDAEDRDVQHRTSRKDASLSPQE